MVDVENDTISGVCDKRQTKDPKTSALFVRRSYTQAEDTCLQSVQWARRTIYIIAGAPFPDRSYHLLFDRISLRLTLLLG